MKCTKIILSGLMAFAATANAMPTQEETKRVEPLVMDLMRDDQAALKSGKKTRAEVAESAMALADQADSEAAKLLLMKGAFNLYVRAGEFDKAIETLQGLQTAIPDMPPADMAKIIESSLRAVSRKNGGQLYRMLGEIKARSRYTDELKALESSVKKTPADRSLRLKLAEHYAFLGDWDRALENFAATDGKVGEIAKAERDGKGATKKVADFWWDYPKNHAKDKSDEIERCFHAHAAKLYEDAIASDDIKGLNKVQAERRIEEAKEYGENVIATPLMPIKPKPTQNSKDLYMVVDLAKTGKAAVSYLGDVPKNGWSDEYKTKKMVLRRIEPGSFEYLPGKSFKITKPFYIGIFEVTQKQFEMTMKFNPSEFKGDMRPVERVSYIDIRGEKKGLNWPEDNKVDDDSYLGKLRKRTGLEFDLPTEVQWEYACRAGTKGDFNVEGVDVNKLGKFRENGGQNDHHVKVGSFLPNAWGLYDMHGNVWEWCIDRGNDGWAGFFDWNTEPKESEINPKGPAKGSSRIRRGGSCCEPARYGSSSLRIHNDNEAWNNNGFRLACPAETNGSKDTAPNVEYKFNYNLDANGNAILSGMTCVSPKPVGALIVPAMIDGHKVTGIKGNFRDCDQMTSIMFPASLMTFPEWNVYVDAGGMFDRCSSLKNIGIAKNNPKYASVDGALYSKDMKTLFAYPKDCSEIRISPTTKVIECAACRTCNLVKSVKVPEGVEAVSGWVFESCDNLEVVELPRSLKRIGSCFLESSPKMKRLVFAGNAPEVIKDCFSDVFMGVSKDLVIEVKKGSKGWNGKGSTDLPARWPANSRNSRPIRYID